MLAKTNTDCPSSITVISSTRIVAELRQPVVAPDKTVVIYLYNKHPPRFSTHCLHFSLNFSMAETEK